MRLRNDAYRFELVAGGGHRSVAAAELHAVRRLPANADGIGVAGVAVAERRAFSVDGVTIDGDGGHVGGAVLDGFRKAADLGGHAVQAAGFDEAMLPIVAVEGKLFAGLDQGYRFCGGEVVRRGRALKALQRGLLGGVGAQGVLVGFVGGGPKRKLQCGRVIVIGRKLQRTLAAGGAGVRRKVADPHLDPHHALVALVFAGEGAVVGRGVVGGDVLEAILHEVRPLQCRAAPAAPARG